MGNSLSDRSGKNVEPRIAYEATVKDTQLCIQSCGCCRLSLYRELKYKFSFDTGRN